MMNNCETEKSVQGNQRQAADVSWKSIDRKAAKQRVNKIQQQIFQESLSWMRLKSHVRFC